MRAQLEEERTKLSLILDLNNSVVSNLELRDVLQAISPGIRKAMRLDGVALILPDGEGRELQLYAVDFPDANSSASPGPAGLALRLSLRSRLSHRKAVGWGYRAIAKVRPGPQNCLGGRGRDPMYVAPAPRQSCSGCSVPGAD